MKMMLALMSVCTMVWGQTSEVEDLSNLTYLNPDLEKRETAKLRLPNGLEVLIISDPGADSSAAAVAVKAGSWNDPIEYPGMAHFCEHMLFQGTAKYPNDNEFFSKLSNYSGITNAFTGPNRTVYMFSSQLEGYLDLLDRFAHFFIDPLFNPANIAREMHAVDQEFAKNIEHDGWREYMVFKELGNPAHPNQMFSTGNSQTLGSIPQSALKEWHDTFYTADRMHLVLYSSLPLSALKETAAQIFSAVPMKDPMLLDHSLPLTSDEQRGSIAYIKPIQNRRTLTIGWELPFELSDDPSKSAELVAYALERGQEHSLYEKIKKNQWIDEISIRAEGLGGKEHRFFQVALELTQKGLENREQVVLLCFEAIAGLKEGGIPHYLFEEKNRMAALQYQYQGRKSAFEYINELGDSIHEESLSTYPRGSLFADSYNPAKIDWTLSLLTPDTCFISILASPEETAVAPDRKERWFGAEYAVQPIPSEWLTKWNQATPNSDIQLAGPNPFLPQKLETVGEELGSIPVTIADDELGIAYYVRSPEFKGPDAVTHLHIFTPQIQSDAKSACLTSLYLDHLTDALHPTLAQAADAGLKTNFDFERSHIHVQISGFSEKAPLLLQEIVKQMSQNIPTAEQFAVYYERHEKAYSNSQKELAAAQAKELAETLINPNTSTRKEKLGALKTIGYEDFLAFHKKLFTQTYIKALFAGNLTLKEAESAWLDCIHALSKAPYPKQEHTVAKTLSIPDAGPFSITQTTESQGNATLLLIDQGEFSFEARAAQELLDSAISEAFFNELRSKQKTGYIARASCMENEQHLYASFLVQSNSHQPEDLLYRFEHFIEEFNSTLETNINKERFSTLKNSLALSLKTRFRNLKDKAALWDVIAFQRSADFTFVDKRIKAVEALQYEDFLTIAKRYLSRANKKRLAILFEGKLAAPFAYRDISLSHLNEVASYISRKEQLTQEAAETKEQ